MPLARRDHMFRKENRAKNTSIGPESGVVEFEKYTGIGSESGAVGARNRNVILKEKNPLTGVNMERVTGIEPASRAWKALVLPLNYTRSARRYYRPNRRFPQSFWSAHTEWTRLRKKKGTRPGHVPFKQSRPSGRWLVATSLPANQPDYSAARGLRSGLTKSSGGSATAISMPRSAAAAFMDRLMRRRSGLTSMTFTFTASPV